MTNSLGAKPAIDTSEFKARITEMNRDVKVLETSFRSSAAALGDWTQNATGLEMRSKSLSGQIEKQREKVEALRAIHEKMVEAYGAESAAAENAQIDLNKGTEVLGKMESELTNTEQALKDMTNAEQEAGNAADESSGQFEGFKSVLSGVGTVIKGSLVVVTVLATAVAAIGAAIGGLVLSTASASGELADMSAKTGISTTRLQELAYVGEQVGTSQETIVGSLAKLTRSMSAAQTKTADYAKAQADARAEGKEFDKELGDNAAAFQRLGISVTDSNGNLRDSEAVFADALTALGGIQNEAERDALAMSIFGKSAMELNPLIKAGADEIANMSDEAHLVGAVMSEETVSAFETFDDTLASLRMGLKGTLGTLAGMFLPGFQKITAEAFGYLQEFSSIVNASGGDFGALASGIGGLIGTIIGDIAAQAPQMLTAGLGILQSIIDAIVTQLPVLIPAAIGIITNLLNFIVQNLPTLINAGIQILIALVQGIAQSLPTLIPAVVQALLTIVQTLLANLPLIIQAALQLILALAQGLIAALPILIPEIPKIVQAIVDALVQSLPLIIAAAVQLVNAITLGILQNLPALLVAAWEIIKTLRDYMYDNGPQMFMDIGKALIDGMWQGIKNNFNALKDGLNSLMSGLLGSVQKSQKINSPSQVYEDEVGAYIPPGIGQGIIKQMPRLKQQMAQAMDGLAASVNANFAPTFGQGLQPAGAAMGGGISIGDIVINVPGTTATPIEIGRAAQNGVLSALRSVGAL